MANPMPPITFYTLAHLETLQIAIAQGVRDVYYGNKRVSYRSLDEMSRTETKIMRALGLVNESSYRQQGVFISGFNGDCFGDQNEGADWGGFSNSRWFD